MKLRPGSGVIDDTKYHFISTEFAISNSAAKELVCTGPGEYANE